MLQLPVELEDALRIARAEMLSHPARQLLPRFRQSIYFALRQENDTLGLRTRGYLASVTARYVLRIWQSAKPGNHTAENTIRMAEAVWLDHMTVEAARNQLGKAWSHFEELAVTPFGDTDAFSAGFAAVKALAENLDRVVFQNLELTATATDRDVDPWSGDTALYAAAAYSGPVWTPDSDISRRQAFWEWWLGSAVASAWRAANAKPHP